MKLMNEERIVSESDNKEVILTTHRVRHTTNKTGKAQVTSIMLDELDSCEIRSISSPFFLVVAALVFLGGLFIGDDAIAYGFVIGLIFVGVYYFTRTQVISLRSSSSVIDFKTAVMNLETAESFIDTVESSKHNRYLLSYTK
jgi:hypothetical protein